MTRKGASCWGQFPANSCLQGRDQQCPLQRVVRIGFFMFSEVQSIQNFKVGCQATKWALASNYFWTGVMTFEHLTSWRMWKFKGVGLALFEETFSRWICCVSLFTSKCACTSPLIEPGSPSVRLLRESPMWLLTFGDTVSWNLSPTWGNLESWKTGWWAALELKWRGTLWWEVIALSE